MASASALAPQLDELAFLSEAALRLGEASFSEEDVYRLVAEELACLCPDSLVVSAKFIPSTDSMVVRAFSGPPELTVAARQAVGQELVGLTFRLNEKSRQQMREGKLTHLEGLRDLVFETWPLEVTRPIEERFGIRCIYGQAFARKGDFLGTVSIICRRPDLEHARLVEAYVRVAAVILQRRQLEARVRDSEQQLRMLTDNSPDVIFRLRFSPTRALEYVSPASRSVVGLTPQELYADPDLGAGCLYPEAWRSEIPTEIPGEPVIVRCNHTNTWTEQKLMPVRDADGDIVAIDGVVRDITARKQAEETLLEADRRKNEFLAMLSHELRNPLSPIRNSLYILERTEANSDQARRARAIIERQINHLTRLVDDLLDVTRITRGRIQLQRQPIELNQLVRATVEDHRSIFANGKIELDLEISKDEIWINGDPTRIAQVLGNLLQNAAKFTRPGGRTSVLVTSDVAAGEAILKVRDTGVGIAPDMLPRLFEPFSQADTTIERGQGGLGLGLMLAKGLAEMHGGTITAASRGPGTGAEFTVQLPLQAVSPRSEAEKPAQSDGVRVLVIEDNVDAAETLREALELKDNTVAVAYSGSEGVERARTFRPDIVLCDLGLPEMDGYEVARVLRAMPDLSGIALVALTGYASPEDVAKSQRAGFDRHVAKPPTIQSLTRIIGELMHSRGERKAS